MVKVLVIDDDPALRRMVSQVLADAGHQVVEAGDGLEGMQKFQACHPQVVIADIIMPDQEGIQTICEIRAGKSNTAIIAVSGGGRSRSRTAEVYLDLAERFGADAALAKPFRPAELLALIDGLLRERNIAADEAPDQPARSPGGHQSL